MQPEDWPWWGNNLKVVYVGDEYDTFACFFQNDSLVTVYRDSPGAGAGSMYDQSRFLLFEKAVVYEEH